MVGLSIISKVNSINDDIKDRGSYVVTYLEEVVYNYPTKHKAGFIDIEIKELLDLFENLNMDKWNSAMMGNTCMMDEAGAIITYHCDVLTALKCTLENRDQTIEEWD